MQVWDSNIIETAMERFYDADVQGLVDAIQENITVSSSSYTYLVRDSDNCDTIWDLMLR